MRTSLYNWPRPGSTSGGHVPRTQGGYVPAPVATFQDFSEVESNSPSFYHMLFLIIKQGSLGQDGDLTSALRKDMARQ